MKLHGVYIDDSGNKYVGQFFYDEYHGKGIETLRDGTKYVVKWRNSVLRHGN